MSEFISRPENVKYLTRCSRLEAIRRSDEDEVDENPAIKSRHISSVIYNTFGELPAFIVGWTDVLINISVVSACR